MLVAIFFLFIAIIGLILYLVSQTFLRAKNEQFEASTLVEEYSDNRVLTQQGDVVFCYRLELPQAYSLTSETYDQIVEIWRVALKDLPRGTIICAVTVMTDCTSMLRVCQKYPISSERRRLMPGRA